METSIGKDIRVAEERKALFGSHAETTPTDMETPVMNDAVVLSAGAVTCGHDAQWAQFLQQPKAVLGTRK